MAELNILQIIKKIHITISYTTANMAPILSIGVFSDHISVPKIYKHPNHLFTSNLDVKFDPC